MCPGLSAVGSSWILGFETRRGVMSRRYPPEFRRRVLDLMESGGTAAHGGCRLHTRSGLGNECLKFLTRRTIGHNLNK